MGSFGGIELAIIFVIVAGLIAIIGGVYAMIAAGRRRR